MKAAAAVRAERHSLAEQFLRCIRAQEHAKKMYARADALLDELVKQIEPGVEIKLNEQGKSARIMDTWSGKTRKFHGSFDRRFEIQITDV